MCLISLIPSGVKADWPLLNRAARRNPDGFGVAWHDGSAARSFHSMHWPDVRKKSRALIAEGIAVGIHLRFTTHGKTSLENCHPFPLPSHGALLLHNGMFTRTPIKIKEGRSDTHAVAVWADSLAAGFLGKPRAIKRLEAIAGYGNKMLFLDASGEWHFINEDLGAWRKGVWYSNKNFFPGGTGKGKPSTKVMYTPSKNAFADYYATRRGSKYSPTSTLKAARKTRAVKLTQTLFRDVMDVDFVAEPKKVDANMVYIVDVRFHEPSVKEKQTVRELAEYFGGAQGDIENPIKWLAWYGFSTRDDAAEFASDLYLEHGDTVATATYTGNIAPF